MRFARCSEQGELCRRVQEQIQDDCEKPRADKRIENARGAHRGRFVQRKPQYGEQRSGEPVEKQEKRQLQNPDGEAPTSRALSGFVRFLARDAANAEQNRRRPRRGQDGQHTRIDQEPRRRIARDARSDQRRAGEQRADARAQCGGGIHAAHEHPARANFSGLEEGRVRQPEQRVKLRQARCAILADACAPAKPRVARQTTVCGEREQQSRRTRQKR